MATNTGTKKLARDRKNGASRDQWEKRKKEANAARPTQIYNRLTEIYSRVPA